MARKTRKRTPSKAKDIVDDAVSATQTPPEEPAPDAPEAQDALADNAQKPPTGAEDTDAAASEPETSMKEAAAGDTISGPSSDAEALADAPEAGQTPDGPETDASTAKDAELLDGSDPQKSQSDPQPERDDETSTVTIEEAEVIADPATEDAPAEPEPTTEPENRVADIPVTERATASDGATREDTVQQPATAPSPPAQQVIVKKGGFMPMVAGGLVAAAIGFGLARFVIPDGWPPGAMDDQPSAFEVETRAALAAQADQIGAVEAALPQDYLTAADLDPLSGEVAAAQDAARQAAQEAQSALEAQSQSLDALQESLSALDARLTTLEKRPIEDNVSEAAIAAYERELAGYEDALAALQQSVEDQKAEIVAIAQEAANRESQADRMAQIAQARAAVAHVVTALGAGTGFGDALTDLSDAGVADIPQALSANAAEGVATLSSLQEAFPDLARASLAQARAQSVGEGNEGLGSFLARQFGARSVTPREGDDPDAVLSRAEAAVRAGQLEMALTEIETLPEAAQGPLSSWVETVQTRLGAVTAAQALAERLGGN